MSWLHDKWDDRFLELSRLVGTWSKDPSTGVGAVVVGPSRIVLGLGYNGFPRGVVDDEWRLHDRPTKYAFTVHAEANALLTAGQGAHGATIYCSLFPCQECAKLIIQAGIRRVVSPATPPQLAERWGDSFINAKTMLTEAGVDYV